eukprot:gene8135-9005_t
MAFKALLTVFCCMDLTFAKHGWHGERRSHFSRHSSQRVASSPMLNQERSTIAGEYPSSSYTVSPSLPSSAQQYARPYQKYPPYQAQLAQPNTASIKSGMAKSKERYSPVKQSVKQMNLTYLEERVREVDGGKIVHHNYEQLTWFMKYFAEQYPEITRLYSIGTSAQNRQLWVMEISDNPGRHEPGEPEAKYIGNIHGNEVKGREVLLQLIKYLCEKYGRNDKVTALVNSTRIHILPSMNPDGYEMASIRSKDLGRLNANGVDLNRNFPDQFFNTYNSNAEPELETKAVINWSKKYPFILSASFHSGALVVSYPYDDSPSGQSIYSSTPDDDVFRELAKAYSENHPTMHLANSKENCTRPTRRFIDGITNGAAWASLSGGMQDYNYVANSCLEVTVELGCQKFPDVDGLTVTWEQNRKPLLAYLSMVHRGIKGFVKDEEGKPIKGATISVGDRKHDLKSFKDGDFWRILVPGMYDVTVRAKGFKPQQRSIEVSPGVATVANFTLQLKQIDGLEEALGHVNRATLLTHDLIYRYDGRDSGEIGPKDQIQRVEQVQKGREGTTDEEDTMSQRDNDQIEGDFSGSGLEESAQAQKLAENLAANNMPVTKNFAEQKIVKRKVTSRFDDTDSKRSKIQKPATLTKNKDGDKASSGKDEKKTDGLSKDASATEESKTSKPTGDNSTATTEEGTNLDSESIKKVEEKLHVKPAIGMHLKCNVPGKNEPIKGLLKWYGHITNLPKRSSVVVAGVELSNDADLGTDGTFLGKRYFEAAPKRGYFVPIKNCHAI